LPSGCRGWHHPGSQKHIRPFKQCVCEPSQSHVLHWHLASLRLHINGSTSRLCSDLTMTWHGYPPWSVERSLQVIQSIPWQHANVRFTLNMSAYTQTHTHTHTHKHTHTHTHTHTHAHTHTHICTHTHTHADRHAHSHTRRPAHAHTYTYSGKLPLVPPVPSQLLIDRGLGKMDHEIDATLPRSIVHCQQRASGGEALQEYKISAAILTGEV
jgi:hypothetical protein